MLTPNQIKYQKYKVSQDKYKALKRALGLCSRCHTRKARPGKKTCNHCRLVGKRWATANRQRRIEGCAKYRKKNPNKGREWLKKRLQVDPDYYKKRYAKDIPGERRRHKRYYRKKRDKILAYSKSMKLLRKAKGLCSNCPKPARPNRIMCAECALKNNLRNRNRTIKRKQKKIEFFARIDEKIKIALAKKVIQNNDT